MSQILRHLAYTLNHISELTGLSPRSSTDLTTTSTTKLPFGLPIQKNIKLVVDDQSPHSQQQQQHPTTPSTPSSRLSSPSAKNISCANDIPSFETYFVAVVRYWNHKGIPIDVNSPDLSVDHIYQSVRSMTNQSTTTWTNTLLDFATQCVNGCLIQIYATISANLAENPGFSMTPLIFTETCRSFCDVVLVAYMNECWHDYHRENDEYIVTVFQILCNESQTEEPIDVRCCFDYVVQIVRTLCQHCIDKSALHCRFGDATEFETSCRLMTLSLSEDFRQSVEELSSVMVCCGNHAGGGDAYDGTDLFVVDDEDEDENATTPPVVRE